MLSTSRRADLLAAFLSFKDFPVNKLAITASLLLALGTVSSAHAQSGTIKFTGTLTAITCDLTFAGTGVVNSANPIVTLPTVPVSALSAANNTAGTTPIKLTVGGSASQCTGGFASLELNPNRAASVTNGRLDNTAGSGAQQVQVQLRDDSQTVIDLTTPWRSQPINLTAGEELTFSAEYYSTGTATAGDVEADLQYTMSYR